MLRKAYLAIYTLEERYAERPPVSAHIVPLPTVNLGREVSQRPRFARHGPAGDHIGSNILARGLARTTGEWERGLPLDLQSPSSGHGRLHLAERYQALHRGE